MQDAMGYIGIENIYSVVILLLYSLVSCTTCSLGLAFLAGIKGLLLQGGNERQTNAKLALTTKVRIDDCFCVAFVVATKSLHTRQHCMLELAQPLTHQKTFQIIGTYHLVNFITI